MAKTKSDPTAGYSFAHGRMPDEPSSKLAPMKPMASHGKVARKPLVSRPTKGRR